LGHGNKATSTGIFNQPLIHSHQSLLFASQWPSSVQRDGACVAADALPQKRLAHRVQPRSPLFLGLLLHRKTPRDWSRQAEPPGLAHRCMASLSCTLGAIISFPAFRGMPETPRVRGGCQYKGRGARSQHEVARHNSGTTSFIELRAPRPPVTSGWRRAFLWPQTNGWPQCLISPRAVCLAMAPATSALVHPGGAHTHPPVLGHMRWPLAHQSSSACRSKLWPLSSSTTGSCGQGTGMGGTGWWAAVRGRSCRFGPVHRQAVAPQSVAAWPIQIPCGPAGSV
jgi:hypothetical protein